MTAAKQIRVPDRTLDAWATLLRASRGLLGLVENDLKKHGLPPLRWYDVLLELSREKKAGLRLFRLQERLLLEQYNLSRLIDRMERDGLVGRLSDDRDGRGRIVRITPAGAAMQKKMWPVYQAAIKRHFADRLTGTDVGSILRIGEKLR